MALKLADYKTDVHNDWCPGCGDFGIVNALQMALAEMGIERDKATIFSGDWLFWKNFSFYQYIWSSYFAWSSSYFCPRWKTCKS